MCGIYDKKRFIGRIMGFKRHHTTHSKPPCPCLAQRQVVQRISTFSLDPVDYRLNNDKKKKHNIQRTRGRIAHWLNYLRSVPICTEYRLHVVAMMINGALIKLVLLNNKSGDAYGCDSFPMLAFETAATGVRYCKRRFVGRLLE